MLAERLSVPFFDADNFHSDSNKAKMKAGIPLNDDDRKEWLKDLNLLAIKEVQQHTLVIACSALKESYRQQLMLGLENKCKWFLMDGSFGEIADRISKRKGHYMPVSLLQSQFDLLEFPAYAKTIDIQMSPKEIVALIEELLKNEI